MEKESDCILEPFFNQWLKQSGFPVIQATHAIDKHLYLIIKQLQKEDYSFPLTVRVYFKNGKHDDHQIFVDRKTKEYVIQTDGEVLKIELDPNTKLLFAEKRFDK